MDVTVNLTGPVSEEEKQVDLVPVQNNVEIENQIFENSAEVEDDLCEIVFVEQNIIEDEEVP